MNEEFMFKLIALRELLSFPFPISSAYRCPDHNKKVGGVDNSRHLYGQAVDIEVRGEQAYRIQARAETFGFGGVGVSQKGVKRFIHLDTRKSGFAFWSY